MTTHTLEMLRMLESAGFERKQAEAVADIVATHTDESYSKKDDIVRLEGKIETDTARLEGKIGAEVADLRAAISRLEAKIDSMQAIVKLLAGMMVGLYIGLALLLVDRLL